MFSRIRARHTSHALPTLNPDELDPNDAQEDTIDFSRSDEEAEGDVSSSDTTCNEKSTGGMMDLFPATAHFELDTIRNPESDEFEMMNIRTNIDITVSKPCLKGIVIGVAIVLLVVVGMTQAVQLHHHHPPSNNSISSNDIAAAVNVTTTAELPYNNLTAVTNEPASSEKIMEKSSSASETAAPATTAQLTNNNTLVANNYYPETKTKSPTRAPGTRTPTTDPPTATVGAVPDKPEDKTATETETTSSHYYSDAAKDNPDNEEPPTKQPQNSKRIKCFETNDELCRAVDHYMYMSNHAAEAEEPYVTLRTTFGDHIGDWCFSSTLNNLSRVFSVARGPLNRFFNHDISQWNVSNMVTMEDLFNGASDFDQPLDQWDVSKVQNMVRMFQGASKFNQTVDRWDVSSVTDMSWAFGNAKSFNRPLNKWNVSNVKTMIAMFKRATSFNQPLDRWDVSKVESFVFMFSEAFSFNQPLKLWNVQSASDFNFMFQEATSFDQNLGAWLLKNASSAKQMFQKAHVYRENLCEWGDFLPKDCNVEDMFMDTNCPNEKDPILESTDTAPGPFCFDCQS